MQAEELQLREKLYRICCWCTDQQRMNIGPIYPDSGYIPYPICGFRRPHGASPMRSALTTTLVGCCSHLAILSCQTRHALTRQPKCVSAAYCNSGQRLLSRVFGLCWIYNGANGRLALAVTPCLQRKTDHLAVHLLRLGGRRAIRPCGGSGQMTVLQWGTCYAPQEQSKGKSQEPQTDKERTWTGVNVSRYSARWKFDPSVLCYYKL
jgi:hypothetical protein